MISPETRAQIRRYFYVEHWKVGTIASELGVHPDTVRNAIEAERFRNVPPPRPSLVDPYLEFIREVLEQHPRLRATRIYQMIRDRGYAAVSHSCGARWPGCARRAASLFCVSSSSPVNKRRSIGRISAMSWWAVPVAPCRAL